MKKLIVMVVLLTTMAMAKDKKPTPAPCTYRFAFTFIDQNNNFIHGLQPETLKWYNKKLLGKYQDVCYDQNSDEAVVFVMIAKPATYNGSQSVTSNQTTPVTGTITDQNGNASTVSGTLDTTTRTQVPVQFDYANLSLLMEAKGDNGKYQPFYTLSNNTICRTMYGICVSNRHPDRSLIEQAVELLHKLAEIDAAKQKKEPSDPDKN